MPIEFKVNKFRLIKKVLATESKVSFYKGFIVLAT